MEEKEIEMKLITTKVPADILTKHGIDGINIRDCIVSD